MDKFGFEPSNNIRKLITMGVAHQSDAVSHLVDPNLGAKPNLRVVIDIAGDNMLIVDVEDLGEFDPLAEPRGRHLAKMRGEVYPGDIVADDPAADDADGDDDTDQYGNGN